MPSYLVKSAFNPAKPLTPKQRLSPHFVEEPRVGPRTLRRGVVMTLSEDEMKRYEVQLRRLLPAEAITITAVDGDKLVDVKPPPEPPRPSQEQVPVPPAVEPPSTPPMETRTEAFPSAEQIAETVKAEQKAVEAEVEKAVESIGPSTEEKKHHTRRRGK